MKESRMDSATITRKLHNLIFSDNFCGLCFENGCENTINPEVEPQVATSDDCRPRRPYTSVGEMYKMVFHEKPDLASYMICKTCMEQLKQSYNFIQNSKSVTQLLYKYVDKLKSKIMQLIVLIKKPDEGSMAVIALDNEETNKCTSQVTVPIEITTDKSIRLAKKDNPVERMKSNKSPENIDKNRPAKQQESNFKCTFCTELDNNRSRKEESGNGCIHLKNLIHFQEQVQKNHKGKCLDCDFTCRKKEILISHINKHHIDCQPYSCSSCSKTFQTKRSLDTHIASHNQLFNCKFCGLDMEDKSIFEVHKEFCKERKKHFKNSNKTENKAHVESKLKQTINFKNHLISKNSDNIKNNTTKHPSELQWEKCSDTKLNNETKSHIFNKDVKKQKPHLPCEMCEFKAWNSVLLECHINRYHLKIKPYVCHICSKDFIGKHLLKKHIKLHTVDRSVTCNNCGKKLANPSCLKSHLKLHTGEKNYPCEICGEKFRSSSIMNVHRVKKHTEKDQACPLCPSKFFTLVELRRHVVKIHWKKDTKFDPREVEGLENHYHLFHDGRRIMMDDQDVDFYLPC